MYTSQKKAYKDACIDKWPSTCIHR